MGTYYSAGYQIPAPDENDLIDNGPAQFKKLVDRVDQLFANQNLVYGGQKIRKGSSVIGHASWGQYIITLPTGLMAFTQPPTIVVSNGHYAANSGFVEITDPSLVTTSQFQVTCFPAPGSAAPGPGKLVRVNWIAVGN